MPLDVNAFYSDFDDRVSEIVAHASAHAPTFAEKLEEAGVSADDIANTSDLAKIPVTRKDALVTLQAQRPPFGGLLTVAPGKLRRIYQSPGPIYDPEPDVTDHWRWQPAMEAAGFKARDVVLNAFSYHMTPAGAMFEEGLRAVGCAVVPAGTGNMEQQIQIIETQGITGYIGLPSYLKALFEKAEELGSTPRSWQLRAAFVAAEPLPASLRTHLESYDLTVRQGYGTAETGNLGYECEAIAGWHLPKDAVVQICDPNSGKVLPPGDTGEVVVTLFCHEYALIRFGTGDLSALNSERCSCGRTSPRLVGWQGRVGDATKVRGMFLHPAQADNVLKRFSEVEAYQFVVTREEHKDYLTLRVNVPNAPDRAEIRERLEAAVRDGLKFHANVVFDDMLSADADKLVDDRSWE